MLIVFEGSEGAGKTTQIKYLLSSLKKMAYKVVVTKEPGGTQLGYALRQILLDPQLNINPLSEFLLYSASRAQIVSDVIRPRLAEGNIIICDRFLASSIAYQGYGRGLDLNLLENLTNEVVADVKPDLTLLLDISPEKGLQRVVKRGAIDRIEQGSMVFHRKVREGFLKQAKVDDSWIVFDADKTETELANDIWQVVISKLKL